jgi:hypothetical protein
VFDDYAECARSCDENTPGTVGAVIRYLGKKEKCAIVHPINVLRGLDVLISGPLGYMNLSAQQRRAYESMVTGTHVGQGFISMLETWYGIQIALLHPLVKDVFSKPRTVPLNTGSAKAKNCGKRRVRYVKKHVINPGQIEKALCGGGAVRHTLVWYVIGHWRKFADGRKVFIKPYWKGALREIKRSMTDREREIAQVSDDALEILKYTKSKNIEEVQP